MGAWRCGTANCCRSTRVSTCGCRKRRPWAPTSAAGGLVGGEFDRRRARLRGGVGELLVAVSNRGGELGRVLLGLGVAGVDRLVHRVGCAPQLVALGRRLVGAHGGVCELLLGLRVVHQRCVAEPGRPVGIDFLSRQHESVGDLARRTASSTAGSAPGTTRRAAPRARSPTPTSPTSPTSVPAPAPRSPTAACSPASSPPRPMSTPRPSPTSGPTQALKVWVVGGGWNAPSSRCIRGRGVRRAEPG